MGFVLLRCVLHGLSCAATFALDAEHNEIRPVNHCTVPFLMGAFEMTVSRSPADFYFIVILPEGFFVIPVLCCHVWQHPHMGAVIIPDVPLAATNGGGNYLVKFSVPAYQELHIFPFLQELADQSFKALFYQQRAFHCPVAEEGNGVYV